MKRRLVIRGVEHECTIKVRAGACVSSEIPAVVILPDVEVRSCCDRLAQLRIQCNGAIGMSPAQLDGSLDVRTPIEIVVSKEGMGHRELRIAFDCRLE